MVVEGKKWKEEVEKKREDVDLTIACYMKRRYVLFCVQHLCADRTKLRPMASHHEPILTTIYDAHQARESLKHRPVKSLVKWHSQSSTRFCIKKILLTS